MTGNVPECNECEFLRIYDYAYKNYYCDHADRTDDMGKLGVNQLPQVNPEWCPKRVR